MRIVNWAAMTFMVLSILVAAVRSDDQGISAAPAQSAATPAKQPSPVTLAELKLILKYKLDGQWEAGTYLEGLVDLGPNARGARNTLYLIFPWPGDVKGIARAKKVTESWNRPTEVVWTSEHWVVIGDGMTAREDAEVSAATKRLTKLLKDLAPKVLPPDTAAQASSKPGVDGAAAEPAISVELGFRKKPPVFAVNESIVVEARFVNRADKPQVYRGGLGDKNIKHSCQIKLMAEGGKAWSARAAAAAPFANYKDIEVPPRGQTVIGEWDLSKLLYSEGSRWSAGGKIPFADIARPGKYRVRWWDGVFQLGTPLRSESADFAIGKSDNAVGVTSPGVAPEAFDGEKLLAEIKKLVAAEDWKAAHELLKKHPGHHAKPAGVEWNYLSSYLQDAATYPDDNKSQKRGRAKAAEMLGLYDRAMKQYELQLALAEDNQGRYEARHGKAMSAWWAAIDAVAGGQHQRAVALLDVMRDSGDTWVKEAGQAKGELVRKLAAAPESVDLRIEFAQKFWGENVPALGKHDQHARKLLIDTLKLNPSEKQKLQLCRLIQSYSQQLGDAAAAEQYAERIIKECSTESEAGDEAALGLSQFFFQQKQFEKSRDWLLRVADSGRQNRFVSMAQLGLAEVYRELKDEAAMVRWLKAAAEAPAVETDRSIMDTSDTQQTALIRLGKHFQAKGQYDAALGYFRQWKPGSWCGNCLAQMQYDRDLSIAECLVALGKTVEALEKHLMPHVTGDPDRMFYSSPRIPALIVEIHEKQGSLEQLAKQLKPRAEKDARNMAAIARDLAQIRIWKRDAKTDLLIGQLRHEGSFVPSIRDPHDNWRAPAAAKALSELGGKEFPALKRHYESLLAKATDTPDNAEIGARMWAIYAIGLSQAAEAREFLQQLLKTAELPDGMKRAGVSADDARFAVSLWERKDKP